MNLCATLRFCPATLSEEASDPHRQRAFLCQKRFRPRPRLDEPELQGSRNGANRRDRTDDLRITNALLYQLSYVGLKNTRKIPCSGGEGQGNIFGNHFRFLFIHLFGCKICREPYKKGGRNPYGMDT